MVGCSAAKGAASYKKFIRIAVFCLQCIYLGIGVCNCRVHKVHIFYQAGFIAWKCLGCILSLGYTEQVR